MNKIYGYAILFRLFRFGLEIAAMMQPEGLLSGGK
jgi:hypothetical protein